MGRELKRVPLDFSWPLGEVWDGYTNPHLDKRSTCRSCEGSGLSREAIRFHGEWYGHTPFDPIGYGVKPLELDHPAVQQHAKRNVEALSKTIWGSNTTVEKEAKRLWNLWRHQWGHHLNQDDVDALIEADRLWDFTRVPRNDQQRADQKKKMDEGGNSWLPYNNGYRPTAQEVNDWSLYGIAHDCLNASVCIKARCKREGVPHLCDLCKGEGIQWESPESKKAADDWKPTEPPTGDGFQLWRTTGDGKPSSPVFATLDELCAWCEKHETTIGYEKATAEEWKKMLSENLVYHKDERGNIYM